MSFTTVFIAKFNFLAMNKTLLFAIMLSAVLFAGSLSFDSAFAGTPSALSCADLDVGEVAPSGASEPSGDPTNPPHCIEHVLLASWLVGEENDRIPIGFDPNAGPWVKILPVPNFGSPQTPAVPPGFTDDLHEFIVIGGNVDWTDWHEQIQTPGWVFQDVFITINPNSQNPIVLGPFSGTSIDVLFPEPLPPGTEINIDKIVLCDPNLAPSGCFGAFIEIWEWPTVPPTQDRQISGDLLPLDNTALVLAGVTQIGTLGILTLLGAASAGALYFVTRRNF